MTSFLQAVKGFFSIPGFVSRQKDLRKHRNRFQPFTTHHAMPKWLPTGCLLGRGLRRRAAGRERS